MKIIKVLLFRAMNKKTATLLLLLTALIWGCSFVAQDVSSDYLGPFTFNFIRFFIGSFVLIPFVLNNRKKQKPTKNDDKNAVNGTRRYRKAFNLPINQRNTVELEVINKGRKDTSFVVISN